MNKVKQILNNDNFKKCMEFISVAEKDRVFCLHDVEHSLAVARIAYIINLEDNLGLDKELIYAMALLHDIGRYFEYKEKLSHHESGVLIARDILREVGFSESDISLICDAIACHKNKSDETSDNTVRNLLYKADKLSRNCFMCKSYKECYWDADMKNDTVII